MILEVEVVALEPACFASQPVDNLIFSEGRAFGMRTVKVNG